MSVNEKKWLIIILVLVLPLTYAHNIDYLPLKDNIITKAIEENVTIQNYIEKCNTYNRTPLFNVCMAPYYKNLAKTMKAEEVLFRAENDLNMFPNITDCHFIAHEVGSVNFEKNGYNIAKSISDCGTVWLCGGGCHHQVFIDILENKSEEDLISISSKVCSSDDSNLPEDFEYLCYHSLGHGLLLVSEYNLNKSVKYCYNKDEDYYYECLDGIFHQYYFPKLDYEFDTIARNIEVLCPRYLSGLARKTCFERAGKFALSYFGYHDSKAFSNGFELCNGLRFADKVKCLNGLFVFPENCDIGEMNCKYMFYKAKVMNYAIELFS